MEKLAYSIHLGSDKNRKSSSKNLAKQNASGTTSMSNNAIQNATTLSRVDKHNYRKYDDRQDEIVIVRGTTSLYNDIKKLYKTEFEEVRLEYNEKQKRDDRKINDYFSNISNDKKHDLACEIIIELVDKKYWDTKNMNFKKKMTEVYKKQVEDLELLVPNFKVASAIIHYDETSPHMHIVGVPIKYKNKNGMEKQVGKSDVFTKLSLIKLQDEMRTLCIEEFNKKDLNSIGVKYQEYSVDNYDYKNHKLSKDDKKYEKEIVAKNSTVLHREESKYNDMLNNYKKSDKFDKMIDKIIEKKNQIVNSIDLTSENAINVYKYLMLSLGVGSAILLGKKSKDKIEKNIKENKIKKEKVKPVRVKKDFLDKIKVAKKQKELKKEQSEIKEKENVVFNNPKIDSKNEPTFENNVDYYNELKQSIDYMLQVEKSMTNNSFVINKTLDEELEYYLSTMNMSPQERALTSLVRDSILPYEIPIEKMTQVQRDSLKAQIRLEQNISLCIKELQEQGYEINTSIKRA